MKIYVEIRSESVIRIAFEKSIDSYSTDHITSLSVSDGNLERSMAQLDSPCNTGCGCSTALYDPVCGDNIQYFSPCYAGCTEAPTTNSDGIKVCRYVLRNFTT